MAEMTDHFVKVRKPSTKLTWGSWNIPEQISEHDIPVPKERRTKRCRKSRHNDLDSLNRIPFEEMFLFGSHPESDILSISQCPGCSRKYKTQWLHNCHWELNSAGEYVCTLTKKVVIPHRSSSRDHHGHHHRDNIKLPDSGHHNHSKQINAVCQPKIHHNISGGNSGKPIPVAVANKPEDALKNMAKPVKGAKPPLMTKAKVKMLPPIDTATFSSAVPKDAEPKIESRSSGSYTLSIPSDDTGMNESVESLLQYYSTSNVTGTKSIQMIATAVKSTAAKPGTPEPEYEQLKFYGVANHAEKKMKYGGLPNTSSQVSVVGSDNENALSPSDSKSPKVKNCNNQGPALQNFRIPLKSKSSMSSLSPQQSSTSQSSSNVKKTKTNSGKKSSSSMDYQGHNMQSSPSNSYASVTSPGGSHRTPNGSQSVSQQMPHGLATSNGISESSNKDANVFVPLASDPLMNSQPTETTNTEQGAPVKKKKKKKSKNEPRKILPLKDRLFDPDQHCGVISTDSGVPCTRSLTCKTHSMAMRRAVPGRSQGFDQLLAEHKKARDAEKAAKLAQDQQQQCAPNGSSVPIQQQTSIPTVSPATPKPSVVPKGKPKSSQSPMELSQLLTGNVEDPSCSPAFPMDTSTSSSLPNHSNIGSLDNIQGPHTSHTLLDVATRSSSVLNPISVSLSQSEGPSLSSNESKTLIYEPDDIAPIPFGNYKITSSGKADPKGLLGNSFVSTNDFNTDCSRLSVSRSSDPSSSRRTDFRHSYTKAGSKFSDGGQLAEGYSLHPMELHDPISAAIEMSSAAGIDDTSMYRQDLATSARRTTANVNHSMDHAYGSLHSSLVFPPSSLCSIAPPTSTFSAETSVQTPNSSISYSSGGGYQMQPHASMSNSPFSGVPPSSHTDYQTYTNQGRPEYHNDGYSAAHMYSMASSSNLSTSYSHYPAPAPMYSPATHQTMNYHTGNGYPKIPNLYTPAGVYPNSYAPSTVHPTPDVSNPLYAVNTPSLFPTEPTVFSVIDDLFPETAVINDTGGGYPVSQGERIVTSNQSFQRPFHTTSRTPGLPVSGPGPPDEALASATHNVETIPALTLNSDGAKLNGPNSGNGRPGIPANNHTAEGPLNPQPTVGKSHVGSIKKLLAMHEKFSRYEEKLRRSDSDTILPERADLVQFKKILHSDKTDSTGDDKEELDRGNIPPNKFKVGRKARSPGVLYQLIESQMQNSTSKRDDSSDDVPETNQLTVSIPSEDAAVDADDISNLEACMQSLPTPPESGADSTDDSYFKYTARKRPRLERSINYENKCDGIAGKEIYEDVRKLRVKDVLKVLNFTNAAKWELLGKVCGSNADLLSSSRDGSVDNIASLNEMEAFIDGIPVVEVQQ